MSKLIASAVIRGAHAAVERADILLKETIRQKGETHTVAFLNTAYFLPLSYSHLGLEVSTLGQMRTLLDHARMLLPPSPYERVWLPYLGPALDAGMATLFAFEIIEACKTVIGPSPSQGIWLGAADNVIMRERGVEFVERFRAGICSHSRRSAGRGHGGQTCTRTAK